MGLLSDIDFAPEKKIDPRLLRGMDGSTGMIDEFGRGLNSGLTGTHAGLRAMAGTAAEALGADEFAQSEFARARELQAQAQAEAPRISSYKDVHDLRSGLGYVSGLVGGSAPSIATGVGAGLFAKTAIGALAAGTLAQTPIEAGDVAMKQLDDPAAMAMSAGERGLRQLGGGLGSAALQSVVPAAISGKLLGRGAEQAATQSWKQVVGSNALAIPQEGFFEGASDALKQTASNENRALDWESIKENAIGGAAAGGAMSAVGTVADLAHSAAPQAGQALSDARTSINERLAKAKDSNLVKSVTDGIDTFAGSNTAKLAKREAGKAKDKAGDLYDSATEALYKGAQATDDAAGKILRGEPLGLDPKQLATASGERLKAMFADEDGAVKKKMTEFGKDLAGFFGADDAKQQELAQHMDNFFANPKDEAAKMWVAGQKVAMDAAQKAGQHMSDLYDWATESMSGKSAPAKDGFAGETVDAEGHFVDESLSALGYTDVGQAEPPAAPAAPAAKPNLKEMAAQKKAFVAAAMKEGKTEDEARAAYVASQSPKSKVGENAVTREEMIARGNASINSSGTKKSEDYSGTERVIAETLRSSGIFERRPDLLGNADSINNLAFGLRAAIDEMMVGKLNPKGIEVVNKVLGDDAPYILNSLKNALHEDIDQDESQNFMYSMGQIDDAHKQQKGLSETLGLLTDKVDPKGVSDRTVEVFKRHARGEHTATKGDYLGGIKQTKTYQRGVDRQVDALYTQTFGDKADAARNAIERYVRADLRGKDVEGSGLEKGVGSLDAMTDIETEGEDAAQRGFDPMAVLRDAHGDRIEEEEVERQPFGRSDADAQGRTKVVRDGNLIDVTDTRLRDKTVAKVKSYYPATDTGPTHRVFFEEVGDSGKGHVIAEKLGAPGEFSNGDMDAMKFDMSVKGAASRSPSRIMFGDVALDATRITSRMMKERKSDFKLEDSANKASYAQKVVEAFKRGVYQVANHTNSEINIPDSTVIGYDKGRPIVWGESQRDVVKTVEDNDYSQNFPVNFKLGDESYSFPATPQGQFELRTMYAQMFGSDRRREISKLKKIPVVGDYEASKKAMVEALGRQDDSLKSGVAFAQAEDTRSEAEKIVDSRRWSKQADMDGNRRALTKGEAWALRNKATVERKDNTAFDKDGNLTGDGADDILGGGYIGSSGLSTNSRGETVVRDINQVLGAKPVEEGQGRTEYGRDEQIHLQQALDGDEGMKTPRNIDGSSPYTPDGKLPNLNQLTLEASKWDTSVVGIKRVHNNLTALIQRAHMLSSKDVARLAALAPAPERERSKVNYGDKGIANDSLQALMPTMTEAQMHNERSRRVEKWRELAEQLKTAQEGREKGGIEKYQRMLSSEVDMLDNAISKGHFTKAARKPLKPSDAAELVRELSKKIHEQTKFPTPSVSGVNHKLREGLEKADVIKPNMTADKITGVELEGDHQYLDKDNEKSMKATKFIGRGSEKSWTAKYAKQWDKRANTGNYTSEDVVFVSAEGRRAGRIPPDAEEIGKAIAAEATILTDSIDTGRNREHNVGEREVAVLLAENGYYEAEPGVWEKEIGGTTKTAVAPAAKGAPPNPKAQAPVKGAVRFGDEVDVANEGGSSRVLSKLQQGSVSRSVERVRKPFGHLLHAFSFVAEEGPHRGMTHVDDALVGVNFEALRDDSRWATGMTVSARLDWVICHELGHVHDVYQAHKDDLDRLATYEMPALDRGGWAYEEAAAARDKHPLLEWTYQYPLDAVGDNHARELYAQNFALFNHNPELMREHLPNTYKAIARLTSGGAEARGRDTFQRSKTGATSPQQSSNGDDGAKSTQNVKDKKQAAVELAKANDPKILKDIEEATDAKQLQRLINHLADHAPETQAMKRAIERLREMIGADESVAYGLQTTKYILESVKGESNESTDRAAKQSSTAHGFARTIHKHEAAFEDGFRRDGIGVREEETSAIRSNVGSFGDTKNSYVYVNESADGTIYSTLVSYEMIPALQKEIERLGANGATDDDCLQAVEAHALQQAYYDPADGVVGTTGPSYGTPAFEFHNARGHLRDTGRYWEGQEGTPEGRIYQVKNTSRDQIAKLFATVTAFHKAMGKGGADPKWTRESGAKPGKTGSSYFSALQTTKYSLASTAVHNDLGRDGFAATHDSPNRHEGVFDWRSHQGKGEGNAAFGAGTYLSTADGVHRSYKNAFTATVQGGVNSTLALEGEIDRFEAELAALRDVKGEYVARYSPADKFDGFASLEEANKEVAKWVARKTRLAEETGTALSPYYNVNKLVMLKSQLMEQLEKASADTKRVLQHERTNLSKISPTYHVSVGIKPEQLLDWDKPLSEQSAPVLDALSNSAVIRISTFVHSGNGEVRYRADIVSPRDPKAFNPGGVGTTEKLAREQALRALGERKGADMYATLVGLLGSQTKASDYLQSLGILGHKYAASGGRNDEHPNYVIYDDSKISTNYVSFSNQQANGPASNPAVRKEVADYLKDVLGNSVRLLWKKMAHAGEYTHDLGQGIIRLSVHALNPKSVAYHEALHAFVAQMRDAGAQDVVGVLYKAASSQLVVDQIKAKFANQPAVLAQLKDPEERVAYMYQMWAADPKAFKIGLGAQTVFTKIKNLISRVLGMWTNDERALHIMEYFHSGEYAKNMGKPNAVHTALMEQGLNKYVESVRSITEPLGKLADAVVGTGAARIRDMDIPAFTEIADLVLRRSTDVGEDQGFIPAARVQTTKRLNDMARRLEGFTKDQLDEALESLQSQVPAASAEAQAAAAEVKSILAKTRNYMVGAGVEIGNLGPDYFPRIWDTHYISKNEQAFRDMMEPYVRSGAFKGKVTDLIQNLYVREGAEFTAQTAIPGMQFKKVRVLDFLDPKDAAPFLDKNLYSTLGSYISQASRRAEWDRRFGWDHVRNSVHMTRLFDEAKSQGATKEQFEVLGDYLQAIDGTLGDDISPQARRWMGNMMVYQNIRLLPLAVFSMVVDPMGIMVRGGSVGEAFNAFKRGIGSIPATFGKGKGPDEAEKLAELLGVIDNAVLSDTMGDAYTQGMVGGTAKKINQKFFKYNFVEGSNRAFRVGASQAAIAFIKRHADFKSSPHSKRWMEELGLRSGDVLIRTNGELALSQNHGLSPDSVHRVHAAINQWVDGAIQRPNAADKPMWMNDPHWALVSHLKQFIYSFQETILKRVEHEIANGNFAPAMALVSYVPMMIAVDTAKGVLVNGGDVPEWKKDWGVWEYTNYGIERAGLYGVSEFGNDVIRDVQEGGVGVGALIGPTLEQLADGVQAVGGKKEFAPFALESMPANALYKDL